MKILFMKNFWKFIIFCLVGIASFLIDFGFFNLFYIIGISFVFSRTCSLIIAYIFTFSVNRNFTFGAKGCHLGKQIFRWIIVYVLAMLINVSVGKLTLIILGESILTANLAFFAGIAAAIPITFFGSLLWVFKNK